MHDLERISSSLSFLQEAEEMREVERRELRREALKVDVEDEDSDGDADESVAFVALRSSVRIFGYSSVLIRTFRDDRIPFKESADAILLFPALRVLVPRDVAVVVAGPAARDAWLWLSVKDVVVKSAERMRLLAEDEGSGEDEAMPYTLACEPTASTPRATVSTRPRLDVEHEEDEVGAML